MSSKPQASTTTKSRAPQPKAPAPKKDAGGGGADTSHGLVFHLAIAMLLLLNLKEMSQADLGFEYHMWLEKSGYGKFDDIVVRYKKSGGKWIKICVQCKHKQETISPDGTKTVKDITAHDFLSNDNKQFGLAEYIKSFRETKDNVDDEGTYYIILSNMTFATDEDVRYPFFQCENNVELREVTDIFGTAALKIKYNDDLCYHISKELKPMNNRTLDMEKIAISEFFDKFLYVCDSRDLENELKEKLAKHCNHNEENMKELKARLYFLVSQMYEQKMDPNQSDMNIEFNSKNIIYKIPQICPQFIGRAKEIQQIKEDLECEKRENIFHSLVTGMAGIGKTQIVRKYVEENRQNYKNVIWIDAKNKESLEHSFVDLAKSCSLINNDSDIDVLTVVKTVYSNFKERTLFVFDNTDKILLCKNEQNEYIYLNNKEKSKSTKIIVISQDQEWCTNDKHVMVDKFSEKYALLYLDKATDCCEKEDKIKLAALCQYWPLALSHAVSFITLEIENSLGRKTYSDVINAIQVARKKFLAHVPEDHEMVTYTDNLKSLSILMQI